LDTVVLGTVQDTSEAPDVELHQMLVTGRHLLDVSPWPVNPISHKPGTMDKH